MQKISYRHHRFHPDIVQQAVWLYFRLTMSFRNVEDLLAELQASTHSVRELTARENLDRSHVSGIPPLAFLAPDIVTAIVEGRGMPQTSPLPGSSA